MAQENQLIHNLEQQIEQLRGEMYQAYNESRDPDMILYLSTEIDQLLNHLEKLKQQ